MELNGTITPKGGLTGFFDHDITDYNLLTNKPQINGETLIGDKSAAELGLQARITFPQDPTKYLDGEGNFTIPPSIENYNDLTNKPQINGVTLSGNKTADDLDLSNKAHFNDLSGSLVTFQNGQELPLAKCLVDISPTQDLHGYDKPWAPGNGKNKWDEDYTGISSNITYKAIYVGDGDFTCSTTCPISGNACNVFFLSGSVSTGAASAVNGVSNGAPITQPSSGGYVTIAYRNDFGLNPEDYNTMIESGTTATQYEPYANICPITGESSVTVIVSDGGGNDTNYICALGRNVYGGSVNVVNGDINITKANIASYAGETLPGYWISDRDEYEPGTPPTTGAQVVYDLDTIQTDTTAPVKVKSRTGNNEISADTGDIDITYINNVNDPAIAFILNNL